MLQIPFKKYSVYGNSFVVVDATTDQILPEAAMSRFARVATHQALGIGCDNLLVIQRCNEATLKTITQVRGYWRTQPEATQAEFIFRMFEPNGEEALCCGNGLLCIAHYLKRRYGIEAAEIMTEIPFTTPSIRTIGQLVEGTEPWVNLGVPRRAPAAVARLEGSVTVAPAIDYLEQLKVRLPLQAGMALSEPGGLALNAYLVFTGEPHLVVFPERDCPALVDTLFATSSAPLGGRPSPAQQDDGTKLVQAIGDYFNSHYRALFPAGINVNFARLLGPGRVENRCYERGIQRETPACGTGALAVAYVARTLWAPAQQAIEVMPYRGRQHDPSACLRVHPSAAGWLLNATPSLLFEGLYPLSADDAVAPGAPLPEPLRAELQGIPHEQTTARPLA